MRILIAAAVLFAVVSTAAATEASWPIVPTVDYPNAADIGPNGGKATVHVSVYADATAIDVEVYGLDGMRVGDDNLIRAHSDRLGNGEGFSFDVAIHPGPGRSMLIVSAKAHFAGAGDGSVVQGFPFGEENAAQQAEHSRCVRQDPDGVWIRDPGCEDTPATAPPGLPPVVLTVDELLASPPIGRIARVVGYVVESYRCPPCPDGAMCKPCDILSAIFVATAPGHAPFDLSKPPGDVIAIAADDPTQFQPGIAYRFEIAVTDRRDDRFDGRLLRSQQPDREPIWTDSPAVPK